GRIAAADVRGWKLGPGKGHRTDRTGRARMASDVTAATGIERVLEHPLAVEPRAIEDEFTRIWKETAGAGFDESSIRLRVLNFVGIGLNEDARERFDMVMEALPERHPCRGIMAMKSLAQSTVTASIS